MNCLITGGNRGLGLEWVKQLSGKEKIVFAGCREPKNADKLNKLIPSKNIFELDVANENSIRNVINQLKTRVNRLDLLINNAGIIGNRAGLKKMEIEDHLETFQTNTLGPLS